MKDFIKVMFPWSLGIISGALIVLTIMSGNPHEVGVAPIELSDQEKLSGQETVQPLIPMQIKFTILSDEEFEKQKPIPLAEAFTHLGAKDRMCEIVFPASIGSIHYIPMQPFSPHFGGTRGGWVEMAITHEILHCIKGFWHG